MKPVDEKSSAYIAFEKKNYKEDLDFNVGDHIRISKYKNTFVKSYIPNWSEEVSVIKNVKNTVPWTYVISDLNDEKLLELFKKKISKSK